MSYITKEEIGLLDAYFRASNYLSSSMLYLMDNPLLKTPLKGDDVKPNPVGHFGTAPGQNFIYVHLNRIINKYNLNVLFLSGPGHGGQALLAQNFLDGTLTKFYPEISQDLKGLEKLYKMFSYPRGVSSHAEANIPGSIHPGGELGYSLSHGAGAVLDNPDLIAAVVVGDGEAETGPLATSWNINKFLNKKTDGVVLPILHRNGYKISNPTVFGRMSDEEIARFFTGLGWKPYLVTGVDRSSMHEKMAATMDAIVTDIKKLKESGVGAYPVLILTTPKGWTGPKEVEGSYKAHQIPINVNRDDKASLEKLNKWLLSYKPEELFDEKGRPNDFIKKMAPKLDKTIGSNKHGNGGLLTKNIICPVLDPYLVDIDKPGIVMKQDMTQLSKYLRDVFILNKNNKNFRIFGPDEASSNRLNHIFEATGRTWNFRVEKTDDNYLSPDGRVMDSYLSEHLCEGMLEGYLLTGRYGLIHSYEAFIKVVESMIGQHAKWLKMTKDYSWRKEIPSLNVLLTSHAFQQDHNGFTHQDPGIINNLMTKKYDIVNAYYPIDTNTLIYTFDKVIKTKNLVNVVVASKHPRPQWLNKTTAKKLSDKGILKIDFASNDKGDPDIVLVAIGETPFIEVLGAVDILRESVKNLDVRVIVVNDLFTLSKDHPHGLTDKEFDELFTKNKPVIINYHGYSSVIRDLVYDRVNKNISVHGYMEEGNITTPFDMRVVNEVDRFHLVKDVLSKLPKYHKTGDVLIDWCDKMLKEHVRYITKHGEDMPYIKNWYFKDKLDKGI